MAGRLALEFGGGSLLQVGNWRFNFYDGKVSIRWVLLVVNIESFFR
jgi:hypothetical protein